MSSPKDYCFEISTNSNNSSASFVVRNKPSFFLKYLRLPLACVLLARVLQQSHLFIALLHSSPTSKDAVLDILTQLSQRAPLALLRENIHALALFASVFAIVLLLSLEEASDTLMVMEDMGVQLSSRSRWRFMNFGRHGKFIPISEIIDIVIHEGFHGYGQVIYYMCVLTRDQQKGCAEGNGVSVIFPNFLPRKDLLLQVWKSSRQMLYGKTRRHYRHVPGQGLREVQHLHD